MKGVLYHNSAPDLQGRIFQHALGCRVERDAPAGYVRPLIEPYVQFSRIRLSVWKFVFIAPVPRTFSESFHFGHDGIVQLGQAVYGSPHHLRIAPFDRPFGQYISHPHVLCLPFSRRGPSLHGHYPARARRAASPCLRHLPSELRSTAHLPATTASSDSSFRFRYFEVSRVPLLNFPDTRPSYAPPHFNYPSRFDSLLLASYPLKYWPRGDFNNNETLRKRFTCVVAYPFVRRDSRTSVAFSTPRLPNCMSTSLQYRLLSIC